MFSETYWGVCCVPQPPRSSHCFIWRKWVWTYDHHSIWIGNWIGEQNRRSYLFALIFMLCQFTVGIVLTYLRLDKDKPYPAYLAICLIIAAISQMFIFPVFSFMILFQFYLVSKFNKLYRHDLTLRVWKSLGLKE